MAFAGPELEAEVLGVGAGRGERIILGYAGEWLCGRPEEKWSIEFWATWPRPRAGFQAVIFILCLGGCFSVSQRRVVS